MATSAMLVVGAGPVSATHTADHTAAEIAQVVSQAGDDSDAIVAGFASDISHLNNQDSVDDAEDAALAAVDSVWSAAMTSVDALADLYPGNLGQIRGDAKQQLQQIRLAARSTISELADGWTPPPPVTTTTSTTTTTLPAAAGAPPGNGNGPGSNSGSPPGSNSGHEPGSNPGNGPEPVPEPAPEPGAAVTPGGTDPEPIPQPGPTRPGEALEPETGAASSLVLELAALTPDQPFTVSQETISGLLAAQNGGPTATMASMLDTVLPPAVVHLVLSPILIIEILVRTLIDGGSQLIGPLTLFAVLAMALFVYDRFAKRNLIIDQIRSSF